MAQPSGSFAADGAGAGASAEVTAQIPVAVYSCNRLGRVANPPGFSFSDLFRSTRRR
ncbi:hypothetical protein RMCN_0283 [Mycolicibacterium novocastrense]|uniref:Uncharacterized protein n=1 Tax=Mycolicibacterium novocastrense TaxID=59813 RepID=A0ABQ0KC84_MYCNV|nr:hypothetical protein RMCN_0283 [Mycolicibacterium novocastrense]